MQKVEKLFSLEELLDINGELFCKEFGHPPYFTAAAPGRINIIGEHTDYNQGLSMPAAINRWVLASFAKRKDRTVEIKSLNFNSSMVFNPGETPVLDESWKKYVYGTIDIFRKANPLPCGFTALIWGNVPLGSGVSSSAAIEVAMMNGLRQLTHSDLDDITLVKLCQKTEHEHLHVKSGLLDQFASQCSREGKVMVLDFKDLSHQYIDAGSGEFEWVLVDSKVKRELADSGYSARVAETSKALDLLKTKTPKIKGFRDIREEHLGLLSDETMIKRLRHYLSENNRVLLAGRYFKENNFTALGNLLYDSHRSLSDDYEVSCPELDYLAETAAGSSLCTGSRMMGGGFGGCTLNIVHKDSLEAFTAFIEEKYREKFNIFPEIESYSLVNGAAVYRY